MLFPLLAGNTSASSGCLHASARETESACLKRTKQKESHLVASTCSFVPLDTRFLASNHHHLPFSSRLTDSTQKPPLLLLITMAVSSTNLADVSPPVCGLDIANSFSKLTPTEQLYAHWQAQAGWAGARIIMAQNSHDGQRIIELLLALVAEEGKGDGQKKLVDLAQLFEKAGLDKGEQTGFLEYVAQVSKGQMAAWMYACIPCLFFLA